MSKKAKRVFISHHFSDESLAETLLNVLKEENIKAYMAQKVKRYELLIIKKIMDEISESDCLVAIFTVNMMSSSSVNQEIGYALGKEKPVIVMVEKGLKKVEGVFMHGREFVEFTRPTFSQNCLEVRQHLLELDRIGMGSESENKPILLLEEARSAVLKERAGDPHVVGEDLKLTTTFRNESTTEEIRDLIFYTKEVESNDIDSLIKQKDRIKTNPSTRRNIVPGDTTKFNAEFLWKNPHSGIALIAIWFEYTYSDDEKEEGIVVLECAYMRRTLQNMDKIRYTDLQIRDAEKRQGVAKSDGAA